jgi:hypothetical protein
MINLVFRECDDKYYEAIEESINTKWRPIAAGNNPLRAECPLCEISNLLDQELCTTCPIKRVTGKRLCKDTPFEDFLREENRYMKLTHAKRMLKFLRDLKKQMTYAKRIDKLAEKLSSNPDITVEEAFNMYCHIHKNLDEAEAKRHFSSFICNREIFLS